MGAVNGTASYLYMMWFAYSWMDTLLNELADTRLAVASLHVEIKTLKCGGHRGKHPLCGTFPLFTGKWCMYVGHKLPCNLETLIHKVSYNTSLVKWNLIFDVLILEGCICTVQPLYLDSPCLYFTVQFQKETFLGHYSVVQIVHSV